MESSLEARRGTTWISWRPSQVADQNFLGSRHSDKLVRSPKPKPKAKESTSTFPLPAPRSFVDSQNCCSYSIRFVAV